MTTTIEQTEGTPASYPTVSGYSGAELERVWRRIESYVAWRWTSRTIEWVVEGPGHWHAPLEPATITTVEIWNSNDAWEVVTLSPSPYGGYWLDGCGPYRFTGTCGGGTVPADVEEAFRRLATYMSARVGKAGARRKHNSGQRRREPSARRGVDC
jgi:hypothetical protein